ncbi:MAG: tetratricopeptide repeat protein [Myxococcota bacterium]|nr:tetratricopeptide repeat protein [Myxococcota bacterium]
MPGPRTAARAPWAKRRVLARLAASLSLVTALACAGSAARSGSVHATYARDLERGDLALRMGFAADAVDHYRSALALRPQDPAALHGLARAHVAAGEGEAALAALARLERSDPAWLEDRAGAEMREAMFQSAKARLERGDAAGALRLLRRLRTLDPGRPGLRRLTVDAAFAEAGRLQVGGRQPEAAALLVEVGHGAPRDTFAYTLAVGLMERDHLDLAISVLSDAVGERPSDGRLVALMDRALRIRYPRGLPD